MHDFSTYILITAVTATTFLIAFVAFRHTLTVPDHQIALHFHHGKLIGEIRSGRHRFWGFGHTFALFEKRTQQLVLNLQEIATADGISVKSTVVATHHITDAARFHTSSDDPLAALYTAIQLALRHSIASRDLDTLTESRSGIDGELATAASTAAAPLGIEVDTIAIRDLVLPADIRRIHTDLFRARKEGAAQLEDARTRAAVLRTLANTAKAIETNPAILKLRTLETLDKAITTGSHTFILKSDTLEA